MAPTTKEGELERLVAQGDRCFVEEDYQGAVDAYTKASASAPASARPLALRSKARLRLGQAVEAAQDALRACELEPLSAAAHAARGAALLEVDEHEGALAAFEQADALLRRPAATAAGAASGRGGGGGGCGCGHEAEEAVPPPPPPPAALRRQVDAGLAKARAAARGAVAESEGVPTPPAAGAPPPLPPPPPPPPAVRRQWYQTPDRVVVDVFVKGVPSAEAVRATFEPRMLRLRVEEAAGGPGAPALPLPYELALPLWGEVRAAGASGGGGGGGGGGGPAAGCSVEVLRSKLEVTLAKAEPGVAWPFLDAARTEPAVGVAATAVAPAPLAAPSAAAAAAGPSSVAAPGADVAAAAAAPASSRPPGARKDWSAVEAEVKAMEEQGELDEGDQLSAFFKKIFAGGDDETRRAMAKSYTESGGTVLSTNWKEVGHKTVEPTPPDGMEAKKF